ncbi:Fe2+/Zn2+ uptake regulation protein [Corynebacterium deserti GIMN1.010]|uniref:Fe2+/Zn2+ uptake regulation protein n=1 Tax=Corynebacterium deserti GIMN1.010 TaxID=931089 RepID=A0A0M4CQY5_9CORY|nr:Fur family transcriptional regulator [Corynebacterium deserti]ALC06442.1 Fe2+/Zn2+ uptake regulation protein [Corynebacterium deserti GIMN1.010]
MGINRISQNSAPKLGVRSTRQRKAVIDILEEIDNFASAKEIHNELATREHNVGLTTVYRTLQSLAEIGAVDVLNVTGGETLYRQCLAEGHHHHLVCTNCGRTVEIDGGPVESWAQEIAAQNGFSVSSHEAEIFGLCPDCLQQEN